MYRSAASSVGADAVECFLLVAIGSALQVNTANEGESRLTLIFASLWKEEG